MRSLCKNILIANEERKKHLEHGIMCQRRLKELEACLFYWGGYNQEAAYRTGGNLWQPMHLIEDRIYEKLKNSTKKMNNSIKILTLNLNRMFPKETYKFFKSVQYF